MAARSMEACRRCGGSASVSVFLDFTLLCVIIHRQFEAWLSLVERCVRDAEVASSNLVASIQKEIGNRLSLFWSITAPPTALFQCLPLQMCRKKSLYAEYISVVIGGGKILNAAI